MKFSASTLLVACLAGVMAAPTAKEANFNEREMQIIEMLDANRDSLHLNNKNSQMLDQLVKLVHDQAAKKPSKSSPLDIIPTPSPTKEKRQDSGDSDASPSPTPGGPLDGVTGTVGGLTGGDGSPLGGVTGTVGGLTGSGGPLGGLTGSGGPLGGVTGTVGGLTGGLTGSDSGSDGSSKKGGLLGGALIPGIL